MRSDIPIYSRRLRPLVPSPLTPSNSAFSSISLHNRIIPSWNQPLLVGGVSGYGSGRREIRMMSSRWNPTPEQLQALEEMYRRGTKTPSSDQIQHIAAKLRRFGKIEGKNVFYWFQNHKARDRQRKRRQIESSLPPNNFNDAHLPKPSGLSSGCLETEHPKKLPTKSNCSTASKNSGSMRGEVVQQCTIHELQHNFTNEKATGQENAHPFVTLNLCKLLPPKNDHYFQSEIKEDQTLELFPITSSNLSTVRVVKDEIGYDGSSLGTRLVPNQFFEFLPTKN